MAFQARPEGPRGDGALCQCALGTGSRPLSARGSRGLRTVLAAAGENNAAGAEKQQGALAAAGRWLISRALSQCPARFIMLVLFHRWQRERG